VQLGALPAGLSNAGGIAITAQGDYLLISYANENSILVVHMH
jgi:hypothetical protein